MACTANMDYLQTMVDGGFWDGITCFFANNVGALAFPLIVFGAIGFALYRYTNGPLVPVVIAIIGGSVIIQQMPTGAIRLAVIVTILVISIAVYILARRTEGAIR